VKLDKKAEVGILIGYSSMTKGYRIYQPLTSKLIISRDVNFDEFATWNWDQVEKEIEVSNVVLEATEQEVPKETG